MKFLIGLLLLCVTANIFGQSSRELIKEAIDEMENKQYDNAMLLLQKAEKVAPTDMAPVYEMGMLYYIQGKHAEAIPFFKKTTTGNYVNVSDMGYAMLGNCYDLKKDSINAIKSYEDGHKRFPQSGRLWTEEGNLYYGRKNFDKALCCYEKSIKTEPAFASPYRNAASIWSMTSECFQMMMFAELFMNLEPTGRRNELTSEMLYDAFNEAIVFGDTNAHVTLTKNMVATVEKKEVILPMPATYEAGFMTGFTTVLMKRHETKNKEKMKLSEIYNLYKSANDKWFEMKHNKRYPNLVLERQKALIEQKLLEPYVYWLFRMKNMQEYKDWITKNNALMEQFITWMKNNPIVVNKDNIYQSGFACK